MDDFTRTEKVRVSSIDTYIDEQLREMHRELRVFRAVFIILTTLFGICTIGTFGASIGLLIYLYSQSSLTNDRNLILLISCLFTAISTTTFFIISITRRRFRWIRYQTAYKTLQLQYVHFRSGEISAEELEESLRLIGRYAEVRPTFKGWRRSIIDFFSGGALYDKE